MSLIRLFGRKWLLATLLVVAASLVMVRLGFWQLDRLEKRRAFNQRVFEQIRQDPLVLTGSTMDQNLTAMEYRSVEVQGEYEPSGEVALRNQVWRDQYGVHLLTPLRIAGTDRYILVDRGWIPGETFDAGLAKGNWQEYTETGTVKVKGVIRLSQVKPDFGRITDPTPAPGEARLRAWNLVNIEQIQKQEPFPLLPVYIQQAPDEQWTALPYRSEPDLELTEGSHLSYAIQWFAFAALLFFGYPVYAYKEELRVRKNARFPGETSIKANSNGF